ncbi:MULTISPECIES: class F sortase [unclassified Serinicoccus]|uniref:class F sortase n=1 Tax=unclassified Serinicoccus TaxID=2643101 RepID=UPI0038525986
MTTSSSARQGRGGVTLTALAVLAVLIGVVALGVGLVNQRPDPPSPTVTASTPEETAPATEEPAPEPEATATEEPGGQPTSSEDPDADPVTDAESDSDAERAEQEPAAEVEQVAALPRSEPVEVRIPSISVTSPLHPLGLNDDGTLAVPTGDRVDEAAWYDGSPTPGELGPTVIEGHVTGPGGRESIFFDLGALEPGDTAEVERADGRTVTFEVYRVDQFAKDAFPTVDVYGPTDEAELRLITCGGEFDEATGHHVDNTVVYARMISG